MFAFALLLAGATVAAGASIVDQRSRYGDAVQIVAQPLPIDYQGLSVNSEPQLMQYDESGRRRMSIILGGEAYDVTDYVDHHHPEPQQLQLQSHPSRDAKTAMWLSGVPPLVFSVFLQRFHLNNIGDEYPAGSAVNVVQTRF